MIEKDISPALKGGRAVFVPYEEDAWELRRRIVARISAGAAALPYVVRETAYYYSLNGLAADRLIAGFLPAMQGETGGALNCAALLLPGEPRGLLLHLESGTLICSCLPPISEADAAEEIALAGRLRELADAFPGARLQLPSGISSGQKTAGEILKYLADRLCPGDA